MPVHRPHYPLLLTILIIGILCASCASTYELSEEGKAFLRDAGYTATNYQRSPNPENLRWGLNNNASLNYGEVWCIIISPQGPSHTTRLLLTRKGPTWRIIDPELVPPGDARSAFASVNCTI